MVNRYRTAFIINEMNNADYLKVRNIYMAGKIDILFTTIFTCFDEDIKCQRLIIMGDKFFSKWTQQYEYYQSIHYNYILKLLETTKLDVSCNDQVTILGEQEKYFDERNTLTSNMEKNFETHLFEVIILASKLNKPIEPSIVFENSLFKLKNTSSSICTLNQIIENFRSNFLLESHSYKPTKLSFFLFDNKITNNCFSNMMYVLNHYKSTEKVNSILLRV